MESKAGLFPWLNWFLVWHFTINIFNDPGEEQDVFHDFLMSIIYGHVFYFFFK